MSDIFSGLGSGVASGIVGAGVNYYLNNKLADKEQKNYQKNQALNYAYSQEAQKNAVPNAVQGLKEAGLNPAAAASGAFSAAPMASAPLQNKSAPAVNFPISENIQAMLNASKQNALLDAQKENIEADTENKLQMAQDNASHVGVNREHAKDLAAHVGVNEQTSQNLIYKNVFDKRVNEFNQQMDASIFSNLLEYYPEMMEDYMKSLGLDYSNPEDVDKAKQMFNSGSFEGWYQYTDKNFKILENVNKKSVQDIISESPNIKSALANVSLNEQDKLFADVALTRSLAITQRSLQSKLDSDVSLNNAERDKISHQIKEIDQQINESLERTKTYTSQIVHNYAGAFRDVGIGANEFVGAITDVATMGKSKAVSKASPSSSKSVSSSGVGSPRFPNYDVNEAISNVGGW